MVALAQVISQRFIPHTLNRVEIRYRGAEYKIAKTNVKTIDSQTLAKYRGAEYSMQSVARQVASTPSASIYTYRGVSYLKETC